MSKKVDYIKINRDSWNQRTEYHVKSDFYNLEGFLKGKTSLKKIELDLLGDIKGKKILHLQCHFGQDSLSLARMEAKVTGVDLSDEAIKKARELNDELGLDATFICCDLFDLPNHLEEKFDCVFTSYGVLGWLPNLDKWGKIISHYLKPQGKVILVEFHPVVWMFDDDFTQIKYSYFKEKPIIEQQEGTYASKKANIQLKFVCWNHSLEEVFSGLLQNNIQIQQFKEFDYSPYDCFNKTTQLEKDRYQIEGLQTKLPMTYAIVGMKNE